MTACHMTVQMMVINIKKLIEGLPVWAAEDFTKYDRNFKICLFT